MRQIALAVSVLLTGCVTQITPAPVEVAEPPPVYAPEPPRAVVSVYVEPPLAEPEPIAVGWAPPPMLVESPPPPPFEGAVWVGGYWVWQGDWVWAHGHWVGAPRPNYVWVQPYYEHRDGVVLFITGHWSPPGVAFVPPPPGLRLSVEVAAVGVVAGPRPMGPNGCFVPPPPGSRVGIIVPAPIGTAPAVVTGAPPVVAAGMRITNTVNNTNITRNNTVVNNVTNVRNVTNITNVTIVAPASATASGQAVNTTAPALAHLAASQPAMVKAHAPEPTSTRPIPTFVHGATPPPLPPAQAVAGLKQEQREPHPQGPGHSEGRPNGWPRPQPTPVAARADTPRQPDAPAAGTGTPMVRNDRPMAHNEMQPVNNSAPRNGAAAQGNGSPPPRNAMPAQGNGNPPARNAVSAQGNGNPAALNRQQRPANAPGPARGQGQGGTNHPEQAAKDKADHGKKPEHDKQG